LAQSGHDKLPVAAGHSSEGPRKVLIPLDEKTDQTMIVQCLSRFPNERFHILVFGTIDLAEVIGGYPSLSTGNFLQLKAEAFAARREPLQRLAKELTALGHSVEPILRTGNKEKALLDMATEQAVDLVIVERWKPGLFRKSLSQQLAEKVRCSVLLISPEANGGRS
jgi:nucleotide-binding universal stress UspA family protein